MRQAGAASDSPPVGQVQATLNADGYYTVVVAGKFEDMRLNVYGDAPGPNPSADHCLARFLHAALEVPKVDVVVNGGGALAAPYHLRRRLQLESAPVSGQRDGLRRAGLRRVRRYRVGSSLLSAGP